MPNPPPSAFGRIYTHGLETEQLTFDVQRDPVTSPLPDIIGRGTTVIPNKLSSDSLKKTGYISLLIGIW